MVLEPAFPNQEAILRARARRERMRQLNDYIPLEDTTQDLQVSSPSVQSRLVREEEEDADVGKYTTRVPLAQFLSLS